jgi:predicted phosphodiesterase
MPKAPTGKELAAELCRKFPLVPSRTLAKKLYAENKERFGNLELARSAIRRARGNEGTRKKHTATVARPNGKAGWKPECPPSAAEPWLPVQIDGPCRVLILSDIHVPYHSKEAVESAAAFGKKLKPDVLLLNGDTCDFYRISRFQQDPKKRDFAAELETCKELLSWLRGQFPKTRFIFKIGNHEQRWDHYVWQRCVELWNLENLQLQNVLGFEEFGIERVDDNPIACGKLAVMHGHELGRGLYAPVNPARTAFLKTYDTCLIGHLHRTSSNSESDWKHNETMTWSTGCLCGLSPEFARVNRWNWGFAHIDIADDNQFNVNNYRISADYQVRSA